MTIDGTLKPHNQEEKKFTAWFKDCMHGCFWQRIETTTANGVPDLYLKIPDMIDGHRWIELKIYLKGKGVILRKHQYAWLVRARISGIEAMVMVLKDDIVEFYYKPEVEPYGGKAMKYVRITSKPFATVPKKRDAIRDYFGLQ